MQLVIALLLLAHGIGHVLFEANSWGYWKADAGRAGLFENVLHTSQTVEGVVGLLWMIPLVGFVASAWGLYFDATWWRGSLLAASIVSAALIVAWWDGVTPSAQIYALIFDGIVIAVLVFQGIQGVSAA